MFKQFVSGVVCLAVIQTSLFAGVGGKKAVYRGGTAGIEQDHEGGIVLGQTEMTYQGKADVLRVPYDKVTSIEYGQKAGRRVGATVALGVTTLGLGALPVLFSKKRKHMVTLSWTGDNGKEEAAIFEFGKDIIRQTLKVLETRSGKQVEYESADAKANIGR